MNFFNTADEFKKNPQLKKEDLNHLKEWLSKQPHLPPISDEFLILFLHSCFYRLEPTKVTIESYFTLRTHSPELFTKRDTEIKSVIDAFNAIGIFTLPELTPDGCKVIFVYAKRTEPELFVLADFIKTLSMVIDMLLMTTGTFDGFIIIYDMKGFGLSHIGRLGINMIKKYVYFLQDGLPARLKGIHTINTTQYIDMITGMMKPFMKKELSEKFFYHQVNSEKIYDYVPKNMMPSDVGGNGKSLQELTESSLNAVKEMRKWFLEEEVLRVDEQKRPGKPKTESDYFGVEGSFKTMSVD
ncbi:Cellular retinaldehyde binding/alpha-tocopherol transport,CRAL-TRIO lipid binding domain,CRAL/TRIO, N- [Cinara cedri]|uniref:Cellular retinaldehyde binding/alpha-tocopherol transport,CRAL-TRIO lipid binding domain,CRAL/TRIO, N n=1 Tax=Cinara cedri TaxID=506608 RepID=A0A5E4MG50_9HEMI|nr:Cellular retinaldehyde binding/alpha-tocopherol transport,CRAL-TRIO lipid binding domain,CRAL/TRIO, N- [Cinara cedri]